MVRSYPDLTIKFHNYSSFFTAFDVASNITLTRFLQQITHIGCVLNPTPFRLLLLVLFHLLINFTFSLMKGV